MVRRQNSEMKRCAACASSMFICFKPASCLQHCHLHSVHIVGGESSVCFERLYVPVESRYIGFELYYKLDYLVLVLYVVEGCAPLV